MPPKLEAVFFATASGNEPVRDWLLRLDREERRTVGTDIVYVQRLAIARWKEWKHEEGE